MKILPFKIEKLSNGMSIRVSQYFKYTNFGSRDVHNMNYSSGRYIGSQEPGVGFFARETASHTYQHFVNQCNGSHHHRYLDMLLGREPSFDRMRKKVAKALVETDDPEKKRILEAYLGCLHYASLNEHLERVVRAVKNKVKASMDRSSHSNVLNQYKNKLKKVGNEMNAIQLDVADMCPPEQFERFKKVVEAFEKMAACRHIWVDDDSSLKYKQVFLDLGIFDFIKSPVDTPVFRTNKGETCYLYPNYFIRARSAVDFDIIPLKEVEFICNEANLANAADSVASVAGDIATILMVPALGLTYYFTHFKVIAAFTKEINEYIRTLV